MPLYKIGSLFLFLLVFKISFAQQTRLVLPFAHARYVHYVTSNQDGKLIISISDSTVIVWDLVTEKQLYALKGHHINVNTANTSYGEKYIVTASSDGTAAIWDEKTGDSIERLKHSAAVMNAFFLNPEDDLVTETKDSVFLWKWRTGGWYLNSRFKGRVKSRNANEYLYTKDDVLWLHADGGKADMQVRIKPGAAFRQVYISPLKYIVSFDDSACINLYNKQSGNLFKRIKMPGNSAFTALPAFNSDETVMYYKPSFIVNERGPEWDDSLSVLDIASEKFSRRKATEGNMVYNMGNDHLLITSSDRPSTSSAIYSIKSDSVIKILDGISASIIPGSQVILSVNNNKILLTKPKENSAAVLGTTAIASVFLVNDSLLQVKFDNNHPTGFSWSFKNNAFQILKDSVRLNESMNRFHFIPTPKADYFPLLSIQFDRNTSTAYEYDVFPGNANIIRTNDGRIIFRDTTGAVKDIIIQETAGVFAVIRGKDNRSLYSLESGQKLFDLHSSSLSSSAGGTMGLRSFKLAYQFESNFEQTGFSMSKTHYFYNKSGTHFYEIHGAITNKGYQLNNIYVWKTADGSLTGFFTKLENYGKYSVAQDGDMITVFNTELTSSFFSNKINDQFRQSVCFENKLLLVFENSFEIWNIETGKQEKAVTGKTAAGKLMYDTVSKQFIQVLPEKIVLYNREFIARQTIYSSNLPFGSVSRFVRNNELLLIESERHLSVFSLLANRYFHIFFLDENNWIVLDKNGNFDGTDEARKTLYLTCGTEVINLEQVKDQLWVPDLAGRIIKGEAVNAKTLQELNICGFTPEVENITGAADEYHFRITARAGGMGETVLLVNGIEARRYKKEELKFSAGFYHLLIARKEINHFFIAGKENPVTVKAYTGNNSVSSRGVILLEDKTKQVAAAANLYAVMVGVSDYKGDELDLKYAAKDAADLSAAVSASAKKLLNADGREHVFMYNLTTAKERYQLPEKNSIKKVLEEIGRKAGANDILLIFFAGHGIMEETNKKFYFLTADASKASAASSIADVGISTQELTEWMKPEYIKAQKRILIFDACNSGQAIKDFVQLGTADQQYIAARNDDKAQQVKAIDKLNEKSGLFILSASSSNQSAYEMGRYSQGLLTYALLKAVKQQPDILEDGKFLDLSRWFNAAEKTVSEISRESGARQEPQIVSNTNFNIGLVDEEVMAGIKLENEKPLFAASNFQNNNRDIADDDLELSKMINIELNALSSRGTESVLVYSPSVTLKDAYTLTGGYDVAGEKVTVMINLKQNKILKAKFEVSGNGDKLNELVRNIAEKAADIVRKM